MLEDFGLSWTGLSRTFLSLFIYPSSPSQNPQNISAEMSKKCEVDMKKKYAA